MNLNKLFRDRDFQKILFLLVTIIGLCFQHNAFAQKKTENINIKETKKNKWISIDAGLHYLHIPKDKRYVPRREAGSTTVIEPIYVGYTKHPTIAPHFLFSYNKKWENNIQIKGGIEFFQRKSIAKTDFDSVAIYKPLPNEPYFLEQVVYSNDFRLHVGMGYNYKRCVFSIGSSAMIFSFIYKKIKLDDYSNEIHKDFVFQNSGGEALMQLLIPSYISLEYLLLKNKVPISLYVKYSFLYSSHYMFGLNIKFLTINKCENVRK
jgi:hypothetical protein